MLKAFALFLSALLVSSPALAGKASDWLHTEGGSVRIVTEAEAGGRRYPAGGRLADHAQARLEDLFGRTPLAGLPAIPPSVHVAGLQPCRPSGDRG